MKTSKSLILPVTAMPKNEVILRFNSVTFSHTAKNLILDKADFSVRRGSKITLMGQNGAGKSTIFALITGTLKPDEGKITFDNKVTMATAAQVIPREKIKLTVREFFESAFRNKIYDIDPRIEDALEIVNLKASFDRIINSFSGGEQARLLLAFALIQKPDLLLLDEPTNNLDKNGIEHLKAFLVSYEKTCIVISHDAEFLNSFTKGVLYLDIFTRKVEQYTGDYYDLVEEISRRIEREQMKNARLEQDIENRKEQASFFAQKGGHMRDVAKKMNEKIEELEEEKVDVRQEDKTIRKFIIQCQKDISGVILTINSVSIVKNHKPIKHKVSVILKRNDHLLLKGPNGIGKTTLLESLANLAESKQANKKTSNGNIAPGIRVGYYRQDFSTLDFNATVYHSLGDVMDEGTEQTLRATAAGFLIDPGILKETIGNLSEGQKGLVAFARLVLQKPGLLILDEPTNHMNFRHIPVIAEALNTYEGVMILVSHAPEFVKKIRIDQVLDLESLK